MVKMVAFFKRKPGMSVEAFHNYWRTTHAAIVVKMPGIRRYVQNHVPAEAYAVRPMTHDGWSEAWWDDLESLHASRASTKWAALSEDGQNLFIYPMAVVVARETVIKDTLGSGA